MATRSIIAIKINSTKVKFVYCHWDGYPQHNGKILLNHYNDFLKINELIEHGGISSLGESVNAPSDVSHSFDKPVENVTVFYGRERGDKNSHHTEVKTVKALDKFFEHWGTEWVYYYDYSKCKWFFKHYKSKEYKELTSKDCEE
ncbi:hypothetical protein ABGT15_04345 [Flavobacterium enshiense]|uniref:hypothetical protein n=1 Tax=Flavobacterium enshiense TaxID=1341165 RepID=UPI00345D9E1A